MAKWMESETAETLLQSLQLDKLIPLFHENDIDLGLLMELSETELKELMTEMKLSLGNRYKISKRVQQIRADEKVELDVQCSPQVETNNANTGLKMTIGMESKTIETLLQSLQLDKLITLFNANDIDLALVTELSERELNDLLTEMNLSLGNRYKIAKRLQKIKAGKKDELDGVAQYSPQVVRKDPNTDTNDQTETQCDVANADTNQTNPKGSVGRPQCEVTNTDTKEQTETKGSLFKCPQCDVASRGTKVKTDTKLSSKTPQLEVTRKGTKVKSDTKLSSKTPQLEVTRDGTKVKSDTKLSSKTPQLEVTRDDASVQTDTQSLSKTHRLEFTSKGTKVKTDTKLSSKTPQLEVTRNNASVQTDTQSLSKTHRLEFTSKDRLLHPESNLTDHVESKGSSFGIENLYIRSNSNDEDETNYPYHGSLRWNVASEDLGPRSLQGADNTRNEIRIALIGKTGSGKSATGNTILAKKNSFKSFFSYISITKKCSQGFIIRDGKKIVVVDTPGIFDTDLSNDDTQQEISKCIGITSPGPHAFILILSLSSRFTDEEQKTVDHFVKWFGDTVYQYFIVLFTRKDELDKNNMTLKQHLTKVPAALKTFIDKCGGRALAFNNELTGTQSDLQVQELVDMIEQNVKRNCGNCYTNEAYIKAEIEVKRMEEISLRKAREEAEERLRKFRESKTKQEVEAEEVVVRQKLREKEKNIRDETRQEIAEKGFFRRSMDYIRSWMPFYKT